MEEVIFFDDLKNFEFREKKQRFVVEFIMQK